MRAIIILSGWRRDSGNILFKTQSPNSSLEEGGYIHVDSHMSVMQKERKPESVRERRNESKR